MWASALIDDDFVVKSVPKSEEVVEAIRKTYRFAPNGDGWFKSKMNCTADDLVKRLRKARRYNKDNSSDIDAMINDIRAIKSIETEMTIKNLSWSTDLEHCIKGIGLSDRSLKHLRQFGESRAVSLQKACLLWDKAEVTLKMLDAHEDVWGQEEQQAWASAMRDRSDARKMWRTALFQSDKLSKSQQSHLEYVSKQLLVKGPMHIKDLQTNMNEENMLSKSFTTSKFTSLLNMYGEEYDIMKGSKKGTYVRLSNEGLVIKDIWSYGAGFLDADGYITITERGEPRAGMIATGERGRVHCEDLYKTMECGVLQLDNKVHKNSTRSQHRLQFYSKADLRKFLNGVMPHLKMKGVQAKAVLAFIDEKDPIRKEELKRLVRYKNWEDDSKKSSQLLSTWGVDADTIGKYAEGL
tara:strand:- start:4676 stop:5902 length:1227 start_codon:yes stop_codon:yes gene_type:complete